MLVNENLVTSNLVYKKLVVFGQIRGTCKLHFFSLFRYLRERLYHFVNLTCDSFSIKWCYRDYQSHTEAVKNAAVTHFPFPTFSWKMKLLVCKHFDFRETRISTETLAHF